MFYVLTWVQMIPCRKPIRASCPFKLVQHFSHHADTWPKSLLGAPTPVSLRFTSHQGTPSRGLGFVGPILERQDVQIPPIMVQWKMDGDPSIWSFPFIFCVICHWTMIMWERVWFMNLNMPNTGDSSTLLQVSMDWFIQCQASWGKYNSHQRLVLTFPKS